MKRGKFALVLALVLTAVLFLPIISSGSIDSEIKKITSYAEDYETGNINYVQFLVYTSTARENMNALLGATDKDFGGILKQQQIEEALGKPNEETKWVWAEGLDYEIKLENSVPIWRKIIFDGKKIQLRLSAYPSIFFKNYFNTEEEKNQFQAEMKQMKFTEEDIIYRLNIEINFKKPENQLDIPAKIDEIKELAEEFNSNPSDDNAEELAKASVDTEKLFWNYFEQSSEKCENLMSSIFGSENKRENQKMVVQEMEFYSGENFEAKLRLEMCDDCQWNWINLNMWLDSRGKFKLPEVKTYDDSSSKEQYISMTNEEFESEISELIDEMRNDLAENDYTSALSKGNKLQTLNNAWNEKSNNVWKELDEIYREEEQSMTDEDRRELNENYGWIKREQERRQKEMDMRKQNYEVRKDFYLDLFSDYEKSEFYYTQTEFEKRLIEEFVEFGEELCDNNKDDNQDGGVDCADSQCGGKICGKQEITVEEENQTVQETIDLYCISGICQVKEEIVEEQVVVCGNHICELGETKENCAEDCSECTEYDAINCSGKVIFSGVDANNCPLEPICVEESKTCTVKEDCLKPLCGEVDCVEGECKLVELTECEEAQCTEGTQKILKCDAGEELVSSICTNGLWNDLSPECPIKEVAQGEETQETEVVEGEETEEQNENQENVEGEVIVVEGVLGNACSVKSDCGNSNDVCSNGNCVTLPESVKVEETSEEQEEPEQEEQEQGESGNEEAGGESEPVVTGESILNFFKKTLNNFVLIITGREIEGEGGEEVVIVVEGDGENPPEEGSGENQNQENSQEDEEQRREAEDDRRRQEERERRENECENQCDEMCYNSELRPCIEECIREACGDFFDCNIDDETGGCEDKCNEENDIKECTDSCFPKCLEGGENWWQEFQQKPEENQKQMEKGVFNSGGGCRTSQGKTEAYIWFNGWGESFERIEPLKQKYYNGGQSEWCKYDLDNLIKQREEFEKGFNYEFVKWFFEDYLANSAEDWEQHASGIFEVYWKNIDTLKQISDRMNCLEMTEFPVENLISVQYESEYGKIEYWEELKTVNMKDMGFGDKEITIVSPYMKFWMFPPKDFLGYEMKKAMTNGEFPGSNEQKSERKNQEGLTEEERNFIKQNSGFMEKIRKVSEKYGGNLDLVLQLKDFEKNEVVFNLYLQINENDIVKMQPMLPKQNPAEDVRVEVDFQEVYDLVYSMQKEMDGERIESPPWDKEAQKGGFKEMKDGIQMYFKVRGLLNSADVYPQDARGDIKDLAKAVFKMMMQQGDKGGEGGEEGEKTEETSTDEAAWDSLDENSEQK